MHSSNMYFPHSLLKAASQKYLFTLQVTSSSLSSIPFITITTFISVIGPVRHHKHHFKPILPHFHKCPICGIPISMILTLPTHSQYHLYRYCHHHDCHCCCHHHDYLGCHHVCHHHHICLMASIIIIIISAQSAVVVVETQKIDFTGLVL